MRILIVIGTRPEAIKLWPVITALERAAARVIVCDTGQQPDLLAHALPVLAIRPKVRLGLSSADLPLDDLVAVMAERIAWVVRNELPDWVVVQGDTSSALAGALAARATGARLAHVEAGLRTFDFTAPWPEERNRFEIARLADFHFAPTSRAAENLLAEGVDGGAIHITGNTAIDALHAMLARLDEDRLLRHLAEAEIPILPADRRIILLTAHRRENIQAGLGPLGDAVRAIAERGDSHLVIPAHPNPAASAFAASLRSYRGVSVTPPLSYPACVALLRRVDLVITDSGGLQEEAPSLGVPLLVTRVSTERLEAIECGAARLAAPQDLAKEVARLFENSAVYREMAQVRAPFGDGLAASRIAARLMGNAPEETADGLVAGLDFSW